MFNVFLCFSTTFYKRGRHSFAINRALPKISAFIDYCQLEQLQCGIFAVARLFLAMHPKWHNQPILN